MTFYIGKGENMKEFVIHKEFACHYSPVFKAAFNSGFIEDQTQTYQLADTNPQVFQLLVQWLYSQTFELVTKDELAESRGSGDGEDENESTEDDTKGDELEDSQDDPDPKEDSSTLSPDMQLVQLWILADKLGLGRLQNQVVDNIEEEEYRTNFVPTWCAKYIYENTVDGNPLRRLLVHQCFWHLDHKFFAEFPEQFPKELLLDYATYRGKYLDMSLDAKPAARKRLMSDYHIRED